MEQIQPVLEEVEVVIAVVQREGRILICRRPETAKHLPGYWEFPGGKREAGEPVDECLARELREELAIVAKPVHAFDVIEHTYPTRRVRLTPLLCTLVDGTPQPLACDQLLWIAPAELPRYPLPPANAGLIEQVIAHLSNT